MGLTATKSVFGVPDKVRFKLPAQLQRLARKMIFFSVASLAMVLSKTQIAKALIRLRGCAGWSAPVLLANPRRQVFSGRGPYSVACKITCALLQCSPVSSELTLLHSEWPTLYERFAILSGIGLKG